MATLNLSAALEMATSSHPRQVRSNNEDAGMGTTLVAVLFCDNRLIVAHIGDSRLYRLRDGTLTQMTRDPSLLQEQIDSGMLTAEEAHFSQNKNLVTRAMGVDDTVDIEMNEYEALPGDLYLLCSDGLNDMVDDEEIELTLMPLAENLPLCATQLVVATNDHGGRDNVSVILVKVREPFPAAVSESPWLGRLQSWFR